MVIRRAVDSDDEARALTRVHIDAWRWAYRGLLPDDYLQGLEQEHEQRLRVWRWLLSQDDARFAIWVADEGEAMVGFASTGPSQDEGAIGSDAQLYSIYLLERVAGTGLGHALLANAVNELRRQHYLIATLWVLESNSRARIFYEREGWKLDGGRRVEPRSDFDLVEVRYRVVL